MSGLRNFQLDLDLVTNEVCTLMFSIKVELRYFSNHNLEFVFSLDSNIFKLENFENF